MRAVRCIGLALFIVILAGSIGPAGATDWTRGAPVGPPNPYKSCYGVASAKFHGSLWVFQTVGTSRVLFARTPDGETWIPSTRWSSVMLPFTTRRGARANSTPAVAEFNGRLHLFVRLNTGHIHTISTDGLTWSSWSESLGTSARAPAAAATESQLYLFRRSGTGIQYRTFNGEAWVRWRTVSTAFVPNAGPAAASYQGVVHVFATDAEGRVQATHSPFPSKWSSIGATAASDVAPAATVSNKLLFVFAKDPSNKIFYRMLDGTHVAYGAAPTWIPVDDRLGDQVEIPFSLWMPLEGFSDDFIGAGALDLGTLSNNDRVLVFTWRKQFTPMSTFTGVTNPTLFAQWVRWTNVPIQVLRAADDGCVNPATLAGFSEMVRYANSTYAPGLIRFRWNARTNTTFGEIRGSDGITTCNSLWNIDQIGGEEPALDCSQCADCSNCTQCSFDDCTRYHTVVKPRIEATLAEVEAAGKLYPGKVVVLIRKSHGGGFAGPGGSFIAFVELAQVPRICDPNNLFHGLGHEIGHHMSLPHTFWDGDGTPATKDILQDRLTSLNNDVSLAFDNDAHHSWPSWPIRDTPADPYWESWQGGTVKCMQDPVVFEDGIELYGPRSNAMSYYQPTATSIQKLTVDQFRNVYNHLIKRGFSW